MGLTRTRRKKESNMGKNVQKKSIFYIVLLAVLLTFTLAVAVACSRSYTLSFETGGGTIIAPINAKAGEVIETPENPTLDGHIFEGWYLTEDFFRRSCRIA